MFKVEDITEKIDGISILVGTAKCNANCPQCAGRQHRKNAPLNDGEINADRIREVLNYCYERNCRYITLTSSGEPMLSPESVTKTLKILKEHEENGKKFEPVNIYTNGIIVGFDPEFCEEFFPKWKSLGLTSIFVSVYSDDEIQNAKAFRVKKYPKFEIIFNRIRQYGFKIRTSIVLKKGYTDNYEKFKNLCERFLNLGVDNISAWPLKNEDDYISELAPDKPELARMLDFVNDYKNIFPRYSARTIRLLLGDSNKKEMLGKKIALFQNGEISDVWCARK